MSSSWQRLCVASAQRPVDEFDLINFLTTGILVFFFAVTGAACARRWIQWNQLLPEAKKNLWQFYGIFCALGFLGCVAGVVAFLSLMFGNISAYRTARSQLLTTRYFRNLARFETLYTVYTTFYALQFSCLGLAKLAVLDRLVNFIHTVFTPDERRRLHGLQWKFLALIIFLNVSSVAASAAAVVFGIRASGAGLEALHMVNTSQASKLAVTQLGYQDQAAFAVGVQMWGEVAVLLLAIVAFLFLGSLCARRLRAANRVLDATVETTPIRSTRAAGVRLKRQILATVGVVFFTFLIRATFAIMNAWAWMAPEVTENLVPGCDIVDQCNACQTDRFYLKIWLFNTPEVNAITIFLSCPVALAVSLWGMTSSKILQTLSRGHGGSSTSALLPSSSCAVSFAARNVASDSEGESFSDPTTPTRPNNPKPKATRTGSLGAQRV